MHAGHAGIEGDADHVEVVTGVGDKLFLRHAADGLNLVADARGLFELRFWLAFSIRAMSWVSTVILAGEKQPHILYLLSILFFADQPGHARPQAATNLILQTGAGAIAVDAVFTLTDGKDFQQRQGLAHGIAVGKRTKILALRMFGAAMHRQTRMSIAAEKNKGYDLSSRNSTL